MPAETTIGRMATASIPVLQTLLHGAIDKKAAEAKTQVTQQTAQLQNVMQGTEPLHAFLRGFVTGFTLGLGFPIL